MRCRHEGEELKWGRTIFFSLSRATIHLARRRCQRRVPSAGLDSLWLMRAPPSLSSGTHTSHPD